LYARPRVMAEKVWLVCCIIDEWL